jgi:CPA1 family monovalent cation:H+ antiporter
MSFFINSIVFLLIGDQVEFQGLLDELDKIAIAIALMLVARAVSVFALGALSNAVTGPDMDLPLKGQVVLWWGGLRGSVSVALALSVPVVLGDRQEVISIVFGVMLFTLLVQGLTIKPLLEYLGLLGDQPLKLEYNQLTARRVALTRVLSRLQAMAVNQEFAPTAIGEPMALVEGQLAEVKDKLTQLAQQHDSIRTYASGQLREELLAIEADTYAEFIRAGQLKNTLTPLLAEVLPSPVGEGH